MVMEWKIPAPAGARVDRLTGGTVRAGDLKNAYRVLLDFVTGGLASFNR